ncbi:MAG: hypothetical protein J6A95_06730 [Clostridia bacterium]|nr:hypothetical protein [Clostridia bacterium]
MKIKDVEKQIKNKIEAHSPSFESVLSKCKNNTEDLPKEKCLVPVMAGAPTRLQASRSVVKYALSAILVAILAIIIIFMFLPPRTNEFTGGYFVIDINPSFEISYDKNGNVLAVTALNEDAEVLLYELELNGKSYTEAIELIVDNCVTLGYLSPQREDNAILTTAISEQGVKDEKMTEKIKDIFSNTLTQKNVTGKVLTGVYDEELNKEAEKYGIDGQKLSLIQKYIEVGGEIVEEQYSEITIRELYHSIAEKEKNNKTEKIDNLKNEAAQLENELFDKITGLKDIIPEDSEIRDQLDLIIDSTQNDGASSHIESLLELLGSFENSQVISDLKNELESKNEKFKKANDQLTELNKTVEEKKNDRLNGGNKNDEDQDITDFIEDMFGGLLPNEENQEKAPGEKPNSDAHFPKEDEHLPHTKEEQNEPPVEEDEAITEEENPNDEKPKDEQKPTIEENPPKEDENPRDEHKPHGNKH